MVDYRYPEKIYLKNKNMTLKEFQDIEYEKYINENRGKMENHLNKITDFKTLVEPNSFNINLNDNYLNLKF